MHHLDDPLARPWSSARSVCLYVNIAGWAVLVINLVTAKIDAVSDAAITTVMLTLPVFVLVQVVGSWQLKRESRAVEENAKEMDRVRHLSR